MEKIPKPDLEAIVSSDLFREMRRLNLADEIELRNLMVKKDYKNLRSSFTSSRAIEILMDKYSLSDTAILSIIFHNRDKKTKTPQVFK